MTRFALFASALALACSSSESAAPRPGHDAGQDAPAEGGQHDADADPQLPAHYVVTADWLAGTISVLDTALLETASTVSDARVRTIDASAHPPGPMQLELTPDGKTAVVSVGPGFFDSLGVVLGLPAIPEGGGLLIVDLERGVIAHSLDTGAAVMGLAISPDGSTAYTADFGVSGAGGHTISIIDLATGTLRAQVPVDGRPEQITLDETGALGLVAVDGTGGVQAFRTADVAGSLSPRLDISGDPSDVAFVPGMSRAIVASSLSPMGWGVIDVSDPSALVLEDLPEISGGAPYAATAIPGTRDVLVTRSLVKPGTLVRIDAGATPTVEKGRIDLCDQDHVGFPLGIAVSADGARAYVALPADGALCVVDLAAGTTRRVSYGAPQGPSYAAVH